MAQIFCGMVMVAYVVWAAFNVLGVALANGTLQNARPEYALFGSVFLASLVACILSFAGETKLPTALACVVLVALLLFWIVANPALRNSWPEFAWYVCPAAAFLGAVGLKPRFAQPNARS